MNTKQATGMCSYLTKYVSFLAAAIPPALSALVSAIFYTIQLFFLGAGLYIRQSLRDQNESCRTPDVIRLRFEPKASAIVSTQRRDNNYG